MLEIILRMRLIVCAPSGRQSRFHHRLGGKSPRHLGRLLALVRKAA